MTTTEVNARPTEAERRAAYTAGLRHLADLLDAHPDLPITHLDGSGGFWPLSFCAGIVTDTPGSDTEEQVRARMVAWSRLLMVGERKKGESKSLGGSDLLTLNGQTKHGLHVSVYGSRDAVCVRRVVGTETVEVPDPDAPTITETREVVEWDCTPILGAVSS